MRVRTDQQADANQSSTELIQNILNHYDVKEVNKAVRHIGRIEVLNFSLTSNDGEQGIAEAAKDIYRISNMLYCNAGSVEKAVTIEDEKMLLIMAFVPESFSKTVLDSQPNVHMLARANLK